MGIGHVACQNMGIWGQEIKFGVNYGLGVVMTTLVVITRVVKGGHNIISSSMGMLHVKTWEFGVRNVKFGFLYGLGVVMTT